VIFRVITPSVEKQVVGCVNTDPMTGNNSRLMVDVAVFVQPLELVTLTVYTVVVEGTTVMAVVVAPVFQR
jgi:hypothetical protein